MHEKQIGMRPEPRKLELPRQAFLRLLKFDKEASPTRSLGAMHARVSGGSPDPFAIRLGVGSSRRKIGSLRMITRTVVIIYQEMGAIRG
jgi:hypothetical protein